MATRKPKTYKCGKCGNLGHNARGCKDGSATTTATKPKKKRSKPRPPHSPALVEKDVPQEDAPVLSKIPLDGLQDVTTINRRSKRDVGPGCFRCPICHQAAVLVLVELPVDVHGNHPRQMRCEHCHNKITITRILRWGATPAETPK